eukprot:TRINITY_DN10080_c0_g1_i7.p1 TRINITY_DN10080_c0_g1~~TRINITY_DN10080_c0_g1_i7.p1  ORF type:complete len:535 (+),score=70.84 TRINITY_DN10080_c0_g1_i7:222-1826(+)
MMSSNGLVQPEPSENGGRPNSKRPRRVATSSSAPTSRVTTPATSTTTQTAQPSALIPVAQPSNQVESEPDHNSDTCTACKSGGKLICCEKCPASYHHFCCEPPEDPDDTSDKAFYCKRCQPQPLDMPVKDPLFYHMVKYLQSYPASSFTLPAHMPIKGKPMRKPKPVFVEKTPAPEAPKCYKCKLPCTTSTNVAVCDECHVWYHSDCVNPPLPKHCATHPWLCPMHVAPEVLHARKQRHPERSIATDDPLATRPVVLAFADKARRNKQARHLVAHGISKGAIEDALSADLDTITDVPRLHEAIRCLRHIVSSGSCIRDAAAAQHLARLAGQQQHQQQLGPHAVLEQQLASAVPAQTKGLPDPGAPPLPLVDLNRVQAHTDWLERLHAVEEQLPSWRDNDECLATLRCVSSGELIRIMKQPGNTEIRFTLAFDDDASYNLEEIENVTFLHASPRTLRVEITLDQSSKYTIPDLATEQYIDRPLCRKTLIANATARPIASTVFVDDLAVSNTDEHPTILQNDAIVDLYGVRLHFQI